MKGSFETIEKPHLFIGQVLTTNRTPPIKITWFRRTRVKIRRKNMLGFTICDNWGRPICDDGWRTEWEGHYEKS